MNLILVYFTIHSFNIVNILYNVGRYVCDNDGNVCQKPDLHFFYCSKIFAVAWLYMVHHHKRPPASRKLEFVG